ncbi:MAG TPA: acetyl-CoA carboxylase biotin carboxylase subunit [Candidatus Binatia bacterium]|nr:acetyl-CoA carboxylase biotin carboxylase subunit [Candidatus Binatia bacterium]
MFKKILVANRGEIAVRIIRAARSLGIPTVAVFSTADREALHVRMADERVCIGPPSAEESYLNIPAVIGAGMTLKADAIHPGYGFLSENGDFAEACQSSGITFIGPRVRAIRLMGDKPRARKMMARAEIPVLPGSIGAVSGVEEAKKVAREIGYPVLVKASAGGGGRGMRIARSDTELLRVFQVAQAEGEASFGSGEVYVEKYLERARHIEFQILADQHKHVIHLGERDCSIQRRYQKVIEESPSTALDDELRAQMGRVAVRAAAVVGYNNVGTIEFLLGADRKFYFIEMNTRLQVEHPVTEMTTGIDIVQEGLRAAAGEPVDFGQEDVEFRGHAIECRVNAEDPETQLPSPGTVTAFIPPGGFGIRVDTHLHAGCAVPVYYDSLIAKVIAHGRSREDALARMRAALTECVIEGIKTNIPLHLRILSHPEFRAGNTHTRFLEELDTTRS